MIDTADFFATLDAHNSNTDDDDDDDDIDDIDDQEVKLEEGEEEEEEEIHPEELFQMYVTTLKLRLYIVKPSLRLFDDTLRLFTKIFFFDFRDNFRAISGQFQSGFRAVLI